MKCASAPSAYRNCILRASVRTGRNFSPARKVRSITAPSAARRSFVRTNAPPLPGLTCWNSRILKTVPSTSMWLPFLNWLVEIIRHKASRIADTRRMTGPVGDAALRYYAGDERDPLPVVLDALERAGRDAQRVDVDDLAGIDEFHALGRSATMALADLAGIEAGTEVVDVGAGLGGPARFMAARLGARVTAVEPTARFRAACAALTERAGLAERVHTVDGTATALPVPDASMDVAWVVAVAISVPDKAAMA